MPPNRYTRDPPLPVDFKIVQMMARGGRALSFLARENALRPGGIEIITGIQTITGQRIPLIGSVMGENLLDESYAQVLNILEENRLRVLFNGSASSKVIDSIKTLYMADGRPGYEVEEGSMSGKTQVLRARRRLF